VRGDGGKDLLQQVGDVLLGNAPAAAPHGDERGIQLNQPCPSGRIGLLSVG
jgi:hypothetical protein